MIATNATKTFEGKPCRKCGSTRRYLSNKVCVACLCEKGKIERRLVSAGQRINNSRRRHLKRQYNLTQERFDLLFASQGKACAICKTENPSHKIPWHIDHDHETGAIRGILCAHCNNALGFLRDSAATALAAACYLAAVKNDVATYPGSSDWVLHL